MRKKILSYTLAPYSYALIVIVTKSKPTHKAGCGRADEADAVMHRRTRMITPHTILAVLVIRTRAFSRLASFLKGTRVLRVRFFLRMLVVNSSGEFGTGWTICVLHPRAVPTSPTARDPLYGFN